eukprot:s5547_g4.t1
MKVLVRPSDHKGELQSHLTTKFVRDWRRKVYVDLSGGSRECWMRRSRLVAREYAVGKRDDTFSPATGAHTSNLLPVHYLALKAESEECSAGYKPVLACLDVKDAFLQVPQEHPTEVRLWGENSVVLRNLPGQRKGSKLWYDFFREFLEKTLGFTFCLEQPCLARVDEAAILIHVDDLLYAGSHKYFHEIFLRACKEKFVVNFSELGEKGSSITFLRKRLIQVEDGILVAPGIPVQRIVEAFEEAFGAVRSQVLPCDSAIQLEDGSQILNMADATKFRSIVGMALYLGRDAMFAIKELAGKMSKPTVTALQHLRKLVGFLKQIKDLAIKLCTPIPGNGKWKTVPSQRWILETFSDADWMGNRIHRKSTSCGIHLLNGNFLYGSSRTQKVIALSSCESELHSIVSSMCDAIYIRRCLQFIFQMNVLQVQYTDSSSARQLLSRQGCGKIRHLSGKVLWVQGKIQSAEVSVSQIPTLFNLGDIGTKPLARKRLFALMCEAGMYHVETQQPCGETERLELQEQSTGSRNLSKLAKTILKISLMLGLEPTVAGGQEETCDRLEQQPSFTEDFWIWVLLALLILTWFGFAAAAVWFWNVWTEGWDSTNSSWLKPMIFKESNVMLWIA